MICRSSCPAAGLDDPAAAVVLQNGPHCGYYVGKTGCDTQQDYRLTFPAYQLLVIGNDTVLILRIHITFTKRHISAEHRRYHDDTKQTAACSASARAAAVAVQRLHPTQHVTCALLMMSSTQHLYLRFIM
jgi:hypothetical protein